MVRDVITTPYSANISWVVSSVVFDQESYVVQYGTDMTMLLSSSDEIEGNNDTNTINEVFSVNITGLTPFTRYYYTIVAANSINSSTTPVMDFTTDETGTYCEYMMSLKLIMYIAPSIAPMNFNSSTTTADSITFQWTPLTDRRQANGLVREYNITCNQSYTVSAIKG